jgi:hypothetical protein
MKTSGPAMLACAIVALSVVVPPAAADQPASSAHVRCVDGRTTTIVRDGTRRSPTFRRLVEDIEKSDVIVYVQMVTSLTVPVRAHLQMAGATPLARYLRILVKIPAGADNAIALLGHELQHATEVAHAAGVRDQRTLESLYRDIGDENEAGWETKAARLVDYIIHEELRGKTQK